MTGQQPHPFSLFLIQLSELLPLNHLHIDNLFQQPKELDWHINLSMILIKEKSTWPTYRPTTAVLDDAQATTDSGIKGVEVDIKDIPPTTAKEVDIKDDQLTAEEINVEDYEPTREEIDAKGDQLNTEEDLPSGSPTAQATTNNIVESMSIGVPPMTDILFLVYSGHRALMRGMIIPPLDTIQQSTISLRPTSPRIVQTSTTSSRGGSPSQGDTHQ
jgi:hypothetical protein